jgi:hypothetical protein
MAGVRRSHDSDNRDGRVDGPDRSEKAKRFLVGIGATEQHRVRGQAENVAIDLGFVKFHDFVAVS